MWLIKSTVRGRGELYLRLRWSQVYGRWLYGLTPNPADAISYRSLIAADRTRVQAENKLQHWFEVVRVCNENEVAMSDSGV
jgi:hypothetical protein